MLLYKRPDVTDHSIGTALSVCGSSGQVAVWAADSLPHRGSPRTSPLGLLWPRSLRMLTPGACRWEMPGRGDRNGPASARGQRPDGLSARVTGRAGHIAQETAGGRRTGGGRGRGGFRRGAGLSLSAFGFLPVLPAGPPRRGAGRGFPPRPLTSAPGARHSDRASVSLTGMCADSTQD